MYPLQSTFAVLSAVAIAAVGCRTTDALEGVAPVADPTSHREASRPPQEANLPRNASVEELVAFALDHHPSIAAAESKVRRALAKVPQAKALPYPKARVGFGALAETAAGEVDAMLGVEQALPFPGKLREMAAAAGEDAEVAAAELQLARLDLAEQVRSAYWNLYLANRTTAITGENGDALELVRDSVDGRAAVNQAGQDDQLRLATEFGKVEQALVQSRQSEASARARLNSLLDRPPHAKLPPPRADGLGSRSELDSLLAKAERDHPSVRAAQSELRAFEHRLRRAELERFPDFTVGAQYSPVSDSGLAPSANGDDQVMATLGISIPLWRAPRRAMLEEARAGIDGSSAKVGSARSRLRFRVEDAWLRASASEQLIALFDKQILPEAKQSFEVILAGYAAGTHSFVDVLDAWRSVLGLQLQQAGNRAAYGKAIAALRSATAEDL